MDNDHHAGMFYWFLDTDGKSELKPWTPPPEENQIKEIRLFDLPEFKMTWTSGTLDSDLLSVLFPSVKPQSILNLKGMDFNTLTDDQKADIIGKRVGFVNSNRKAILTFVIVGIHEDGGLIVESED